VLILLPPSEGKTRPARGKPLDLSQLSLPALTPARRAVLDALVRVCRTRPADALTLLGLSPTQDHLVVRDAELESEPTSTADRIYTGVLYDALDLRGLDAAARRRASRQIIISSALFGAVRINDRIPAYRCSAGATLPGCGALNSHWRSALGPVMTEMVGDRLAVDLRSGPYASMWRPTRALAQQLVTVRVLAEHRDGRRVTVSHSNKATKGFLARALLVSPEVPRSLDGLAHIWSRAGYVVQTSKPDRPGRSGQLDIITTA